VRVNVYAEEMTGRVELVEKTINGTTYTGVRFWLYLPVSLPGARDAQGLGPTAQGPFLHKGEDDDDSSAVTFWGKKDLRATLARALDVLEAHHAKGKTA
jgi:hypothetical protein